MANDSVWHKEQERRKNDIIRVYNPTNNDFVVKYDMAHGVKRFRVAAKSEAPLVRYIAERYIQQMFEKIVADKVTEKINEENEKRSQRGAEMMNRYKEQLSFESNAYNTVLKEEARKLISILYVGLESEFGIDNYVEETEPLPTEDNRPAFQRIFDDVKKEKESLPEKEDTNTQETGEKPTTESFECDYPGCNMVAKSSAGLISHKRTHRDDIEQKKEDAVKGISQ